MIENKFLYISNRKRYNELWNQGDIKNDSIVFVESDGTIHTHGRQFGGGSSGSGSGSSDDDWTKEIEEKVEQSRRELENLANELLTNAEEWSRDAYTRAKEAFDKATDAIASAKERLENLQQDTEYNGDVSYADGTVKSWAEALNKLNGTITYLENKLDAVNGRIKTYGSFVNADKELLTEYLKEINVAQGDLKEQLRYIDVTKRIYNVLGREMDAQNGIIKDYVEHVLDDSLASRVTTILNGLEPSWTTLVEQVRNTENGVSTNASQISILSNSITALTAADDDLSRRISALSTKVDEDSASFTALAEWQSRVDDDLETAGRNIAQLMGQASETGAWLTLEALYDAIEGQDGIAARIFAYANVNGSGIELSADKIKFTGSSVKITTDYLDLNSLTTWANNLNIGSHSEGGTTYVENPYDDTAVRDWLQRLLTAVDEMDDNYPDAHAYLRSTGIVFDNIANAGQIVSMTSTLVDDGVSRTIPAGVAHTRISDGKHGYLLQNDGSGSLAFGHITWDANGVLSINGNQVSVNGSNVLTQGSFEDDIMGSTVITNWINGKVSGLSDSEKEELKREIIDNFDLSEYVKSSVLNATLTGYVQKTGIKSVLADALDCTVAELESGISFANAWSDDANTLITTSNMGSKLTDYAKTSDVGTVSSNVTTLSTKLNNDYYTKSQIDSEITTVNNKFGSYVTTSAMNTALDGYVTSATLGSYYTKTEADNMAASKASSAISTWVNNNDDKLFSEAKVQAVVNNNKATIKAWANEEASGMTFSADNITIGNSNSVTTVSGKLKALDAQFNNITAKSLSAEDTVNNTKMIIDADSLTFTKNDKLSIDLDGSTGKGKLANGNIYWDADGNLYAKNINIDPYQNGGAGNGSGSGSGFDKSYNVIVVTDYTIHKTSSGPSGAGHYTVYKNGFAVTSRYLSITSASGPDFMFTDVSGSYDAAEFVRRAQQDISSYFNSGDKVLIGGPSIVNVDYRYILDSSTISSWNTTGTYDNKNSTAVEDVICFPIYEICQPAILTIS